MVNQKTRFAYLQLGKVINRRRLEFVYLCEICSLLDFSGSLNSLNLRCSERRLSKAKPVSKPSEWACSTASAGFRHGLRLLNRRSSVKLNSPRKSVG
jgi:hypothetical protein